MATLNTYFPATSRRIRRILAVGALALASSFALVGLVPERASSFILYTPTPGTGATANPCPNATMVPRRATPRSSSSSDVIVALMTDRWTEIRAENAVVCLINERRRAVGLPQLAYNADLREAARNRSNYITEEDYFSHLTRDGRTPVDFMRAAGYCPAPTSCNPLGYVPGPEILYWGSGSLPSPQGAVQSWIRSEHHRPVLEDRRFTETGVGVSLYAPTSDTGQAATYTQLFGTH